MTTTDNGATAGATREPTWGTWSGVLSGDRTVYRTPRATIERIDPAIAEDWLQRWPDNPGRAGGGVKPPKVAQYERDMRAGQWFVSDQAISFGVDGRLVNGYHRLNAIVASGCVIYSLVLRGVEDDAVRIIDSALPRKFSDIIRLPNSNSVAAIARMWWSYSAQDFALSGSPSHRELMDILNLNPSIYAAATRVNTLDIGLIMARTSPAFIYAWVVGKHPEKAEAFLDGLGRGIALSETDARLHLRERMIANRRGKAKLHRTEVLALAIKAWNAYSHGVPTRSLRWRSAGPRSESFPLIQF